jgi:hypothetical protein
MISEKRTVIVRDVELYWAKLVKPVEPFGTLQWELQMRTRDKDEAKKWKEDFYLNTKTEEDDEGVFYKTNVKRKALKKDGDQNTAPDVLDNAKAAIDGNKVGNGSTGNVMLFQYPYDVGGRKGVASILSKVQVTDLKEYTPSTETDFDVIGDAEAGDSQVDF